LLKSRLWDCAETRRGSPVDRTDWKAYENLINQFADDSGHTAQEF